MRKPSFLYVDSCDSVGRSVRTIREIVEHGHAIGFRPYTDFPRILERVVIPFDGFLAVVCHDEVITLKVHTQAVPYVWGDFRAGVLLLGALAIDGVINRDVVFQRIGSRDVIVVLASLRRQIRPPAWSSLPEIGLNLTSTKPSFR